MPVVGHIYYSRIRISGAIEPRPNVRGPISVFKFTGFLILNNSPAASSSFIQPRISDIAYSPLWTDSLSRSSDKKPIWLVRLISYPEFCQYLSKHIYPAPWQKDVAERCWHTYKTFLFFTCQKAMSYQKFTASVSPYHGISRETTKAISSRNMKEYPPKRYYRINEMAKYFSISERSVYRLLDEGHLTGTIIRKCMRVSAEEIKRFEEKLAETTPFWNRKDVAFTHLSP